MRRGLRDATYNRLYPIRLESWTVCRRHYKGSMFSQVVNKDPIVGLARGQFNKTFTSYLQQQSFKVHTYLVTNDQHVRLSFQFLETKRISLNELGINTTFSFFLLLFFLSPVSRMVIKILTCFALHKVVSFTEIKKIPIIILQDVHQRTVS